jgi:Mg-chelatase subunit ChlD
MHNHQVTNRFTVLITVVSILLASLSVSAHAQDERTIYLPLITSGSTKPDTQLEPYNAFGTSDYSPARSLTLAQEQSPFDITISLYRSPINTDAERAPYERIIEYFADGVYEASNGIHKIGTVTIYTGSDFGDKADIVWVENCHPNAHPAGRGTPGQHINMCDIFDSTNFLADDQGWRGGGYTLAHEWGHYFYGLYDEYRGSNAEVMQKSFNKQEIIASTILEPFQIPFFHPWPSDVPVSDSIMNSQWNAIGGDFKWLNFSTAKNNTKKNAQHRVYGASGWETLVRSPANDPRDGERNARPNRIYYPELSSASPKENEAPAVNLPNAEARSDLEIVWASKDVTFQIVIDHSGSMDSENKMENAKTAAKLLIDLAQINRTTAGIIMFDEQITVVQPLTKIDSQETQNAIKAKIDTIQPDGATAIGDAAQRALDDLLAAGQQEINQIVYLLTDGVSNTGVDPLSIIPAYQSARIPLFTFGYGSDVQGAILQQMAQDTGGKYYFSPTNLTALTQVLQDAQELTSPSVGIATGNATVPTSAPSSFPIFVDSTLNELNIVLSYQGSPSEVALLLLAPDGNPGGTMNCTPSGIETICLASISTPMPGNWALQVTSIGRDIDMTYRVSGAGETTMTYAATVASLTGDLVHYPEPIVLLAILSKEWPILGAVVNATVQNPDGTINSFPLQDNGVPPDDTASDGLYSAILDYPRDGSYNITVQFNNSAGTAQLTESSFLPSIGPNGEAIAPSSPIPVVENFQRFARIQVNVAGVQLDDHGNTASSATLLPIDNTNFPGKIDYQDDFDLFRVNTTTAGRFILRVSNLALGMQPRIRLLASDTTTVLADLTLPENASSNGYLNFPLLMSSGDTIYVEVSHKQGGSKGFYEISVGEQVTGDVTPGDCNADQSIGASDLTALALEFFDGDDNNNLADVANGSYTGSPACDANEDTKIGASDLTCIGLIFFNGPNACTVGASATAGGPVLSIPDALPATAGSAVAVPITLQTNGSEVSSLLFSLDYDERWLSFDPADNDQDGLPDALAFTVPQGYVRSVSFDPTDTDGELDIVLASFASPPVALSDGPLATLTLTASRPPTTTTAALHFASTPPASFGDRQGRELVGTTAGGSLHISPPNAGLTPTLYLPLIRQDQ